MKRGANWSCNVVDVVVSDVLVVVVVVVVNFVVGDDGVVVGGVNDITAARFFCKLYCRW